MIFSRTKSRLPVAIRSTKKSFCAANETSYSSKSIFFYLHHYFKQQFSECSLLNNNAYNYITRNFRFTQYQSSFTLNGSRCLCLGNLVHSTCIRPLTRIKKQCSHRSLRNDLTLKPLLCSTVCVGGLSKRRKPVETPFMTLPKTIFCKKSINVLCE